MNKRVLVTAITGISDHDNMLIIQDKGSEYINRFNEDITEAMIGEEIEKKDIDIADCRVIVIKNVLSDRINLIEL